MAGKFLASAIACCALAIAFAPAAAMADKPSYGCGPGFDLGSQTFESYLTLPRTQAAINDGLATAQDILDGLAVIDKNGDGSVCVKLNHGFEVSSRPFAAYLYEVSDDNAAVR